MSRVEAILAFLDARGVAAAMIGGAALAVHGVARATLDIDLLTDDPRVLDPEFWTAMPADPPPEIRRGDASDPLAGVIRCNAAGDPVDLLVGRGRFISEVVARRGFIDAGGFRIPVVDAPDLILLKLSAGGPQDLLDVRLLLHGDPGNWRATVEQRIAQAPRDAQNTWKKLEASDD